MRKKRYWKILDYAAEYSLYALILFIPISNAAIESFFGLLFLSFLLKKIIKPDFAFLKSWANLFVLFFFLFLGLSLFNSAPYLVKSLRALFFKWLEYILIFIITQDTLEDNPKRIRNCLIILLGMGSLVAIDALSQRFMGIEFLRQKEMVALWGKSVFHGSGVTASFEHYNDFGTYLVFMLSLVFALLISKAKRIDKLFLFFLLLLLQASLILTFSRGSWLALGHVFLLMLPLLIVKNKFSIFKVIAYVLIFLIIILVIPGLGKHLIFILSTKTDADRLIVWQQTINMIKLHPFLGFGLGTFMDNFQDYMPKELFYMRYVHNCYLQIWAEAGIFSLLSFLIFTVSILYRGIKGFYSAQNSNFTLLGFTCGFLGIMVHSFFDTPLYSLQLSALFWFMAGFILALARLGKKKEIL